MDQIEVLDCTLRDGGYYNDWDFDPDLVSSYLRAMAESGIRRVEIGFRMAPQPHFMGPYAYSTDKFLKSLAADRALKLGVMINASEYIRYFGGGAKAVSLFFADRKDSVVDFVRIATHFDDIDACREIAGSLKQLGYDVCVNLMQSAGRSQEQLASCARKISSWNAVKVLYFADSFGGMVPKEVESTIAALRLGWDGVIGIHAHDNAGKALANSIRAVELGTQWVDATVLGMGRGAGNVATENLLIELSRLGHGNFSVNPLLPLVIGKMAALKDRYRWGSNALYFLSATYNIHPTYMQELLSSGQYDTYQILSALEFLQTADAKSFSKAGLQQALAQYSGESRGAFQPKGFAQDKDVLLVGSGPSLERHLEGITQFIEAHRPCVLCMNVNPAFPAKWVDAYLAAHKLRLISEAHRYLSLEKPLICPFGELPESVRETVSGLKILDYGMRVTANRFEIADDHCSVPAPLAIAYGFAFAKAAGARKIFLAGCDGYPSNDARQIEMNHICTAFQNMQNPIPVVSITPTTYQVARGSVYAPVV